MCGCCENAREELSSLAVFPNKPTCLIFCLEGSSGTLKSTLFHFT